MDRCELREKLIADMKANLPSTISHFTQWCKKYNYIDLIKSHTSYLPDSCKFTERIYHIFHDLTERPQCKQCNNSFVNFKSLQEGYYNYCSYSCSVSSPTTQDKMKQTCLNNHSVEHALQSKKIRDNFKQTCLERYGVEHSFLSDDVQRKKEQTCLENHGVKNPFHSKGIQERIQQTNLKKYGNVCSLHGEEIREKTKQTNLERYGVENPMQAEIPREKTKQTNLERYGVENPMQAEIPREKSSKTHLQNSFQRLLTSDRLKDHYEPLFKLDEFVGVKLDNNIQYYTFRCKKCNTEFKDNIANGRVPRCPTCYPINQSTGETEVAEFCRKYYSNLLKGTYSIIPPKELDVYIPDINLAIEYNGLYWHSEGKGKIRNFHQDKTIYCLQQGINLVHIFEDEWINKRSIVESILLNKFDKIQDRVYARQCKLTTVDSQIARDFYLNNHIAGYVNGITIGLIYNNELVSTITVGKPRFSSNHSLEIYRFCSKLNTIVVGGFSRLLSNVIKYMKPASIITFADLRYGLGGVYKKAGFTYLEVTNPNCYYFRAKDGCQRFSRNAFQKHKLESKLELYDHNLTEWENIQLNGYDRIWDCGHVKYELIIR